MSYCVMGKLKKIGLADVKIVPAEAVIRAAVRRAEGSCARRTDYRFRRGKFFSSKDLQRQQKLSLSVGDSASSSDMTFVSVVALA